MGDLRQYYSADDKPYSGADLLLAGFYDVKIIGDDKWIPNKKGNGEHQLVRMIVVGGECDGCIVIDRLNLKHENPEVVRIARKTLAAIREATGVHAPESIMDMAGIRFTIKVEREKWQDNSERWSNRVSRYIKMGDNTTPPAQRNTPKAAPSSDDIPPWAA